jgi:hypothetical protein
MVVRYPAKDGEIVILRGNHDRVRMYMKHGREYTVKGEEEMPSLTNLNLSRCVFSIDTSLYPNLEKLTLISVDYANPDITNLPLRSLNLTCVPFIGEFPKTLQKITLNLNYTGIDKVIIKDMELLTSLRVSGGVAHVSGCPNLVSVNKIDSVIIEDDGTVYEEVVAIGAIKTLNLELFPNLRSLHLYGGPILGETPAGEIIVHSLIPVKMDYSNKRIKLMVKDQEILTVIEWIRNSNIRNAKISMKNSIFTEGYNRREAYMIFKELIKEELNTAVAYKCDTFYI